MIAVAPVQHRCSGRDTGHGTPQLELVADESPFAADGTPDLRAARPVDSALTPCPGRLVELAAEGVPTEVAVCRFAGEVVLARLAVEDEPGGYRGVRLRPIEHHTAEVEPWPLRIPDVLDEWRRAERQSLAADLQQEVAVRLLDEIRLLRGLYQQLVRQVLEDWDRR